MTQSIINFILVKNVPTYLGCLNFSNFHTWNIYHIKLPNQKYDKKKAHVKGVVSQETGSSYMWSTQYKGSNKQPIVINIKCIGFHKLKNKTKQKKHADYTYDPARNIYVEKVLHHDGMCLST